MVRVFLGPKKDEYDRDIDIHENRMNFVELDRFKHDLVSGPSIIERDSKHMMLATDRTPLRKLHEMAKAGEVTVHGSELYYAFPKRYVLPTRSRSRL